MLRLSESAVGRLSVLAAAVLWSTNGLFVKSPIFADWNDSWRGALLAFWRALFAAIALAPLVRRPQWNIRLVWMALSFVAMNGTFLQSMVWTTAGNAILLQNMAPLWVCIFARMTGERLDWRDLTMLAIALAGIGLILTNELIGTDWSGTAPWGVVLGVLSGVVFAGVVHFLRRLREFDSAFLIVLNLASTAVVFSPAPFVSNIWPSGMQWVALIAFGSVQMAAPYYLFARGLKKIAAAEGSCIALLELVLVPIWVFLMYAENPQWWTKVGGAMIVGGLLWRYFPRAPAKA